MERPRLGAAERSTSDLPTLWQGAVRMLPWEIRADEFTFPPPPIQPGEVRLVRELMPEEKARRRYYIDVRAIPLHPETTPDPGRKLVPTVRVLLEIVGGVLTTPRLKEWREHMVSRVFWTDLGHFWGYRPATEHEVELFTRVVEGMYPKGIEL